MDRGRKALPVQNKACHQRYVQRCQERHRQKVRKSLVRKYFQKAKSNA